MPVVVKSKFCGPSGVAFSTIVIDPELRLVYVQDTWSPAASVIDAVRVAMSWFPTPLQLRSVSAQPATAPSVIV